MSPLRIVHDFPRLRTEAGGPVRAVLDLCAAMARRGHRVTLLTLDDAEAPVAWKDAPAEANPRVIVLPASRRPAGMFSRAAIDAAARVLRDADLLHVHGVWQIDNIQLSRLARRMGRPYFISVRGMLDDWSMAQRKPKKLLFLALLGRRWLEIAAAVHLTAQGEMDQAKKWFPRGRGIVIPNLLDLAPFENPPGPDRARARVPILKAGRPVLLFLSRVHYKKGTEHLLRAARLLCDRGTPVSVVIAGSGDPDYVKHLHRLTVELRLTDSVAFVGHIVGEDKVSLYQAADLFVLPTSQENFGFVLIEALACRTPVVTTRGVDIWPELEASGGAVTCDADAESLASGIAPLLGDSQRRHAMGRAGRDWVFSQLNEGRLVERFEAMYEHALLPMPRRSAGR